ncbi:GA-binding protein subunit beta-1-like, partial [Hydractinia symbiolongicarpus]|uniref:GA-binding protein subunit beta-1-like n=1 Tax=Hydractinia symbiolongicarpus TaxID=13093 RepID=UPI0025519C9B
KRGLSPLHSCAVFSHNDISDILNYLCNLESIGIDGRDNYLRSPLIYAVIKGSKACCDILLSNGANINLKDKLGLSSMHYASMLHDSSVIKFLLSKSDADIHAKDHFSDIPLVCAAAAGRIDIVNMLYPLYNVNSALYNRLLSVGNINDHSNVTRTIQMKEELFNTIAAETKSFELSKRKYKKWLDKKIKVTAEEEKIKGNSYVKLKKILRPRIIA